MKILISILAIVVLIGMYPAITYADQTRKDSAQLAMLKSDARLCRSIKDMRLFEWQGRCMWAHAEQKLITYEQAQAKCHIQVDSCSNLQNLH